MNELKLGILEKEFGQKIRWIINLRWFFAIGVFVLITGARYIFNMKLPLLPLYLGNAALVIYNGLFFLYNQRLESQKDKNACSLKVNRLANIQISLDLIVLTYMIHFSGGVESPFIFYFVFHMVIASILLSNNEAYYQATFAIFILGITMCAEYLGGLHHNHIGWLIPRKFCLLSSRYFLGEFLVFATTMYITIYMTTSIVNSLRERERELAIVNEKLEEQNRLKSRYVQTVSHDLQASLSAIQCCLQVVLCNMTGSISEKTREMLARAEQRSKQVLHFAKDLLDLSRIRAAKEIEKKPVLLSEVVKRVIEQLKVRAEEKRLTIVMENFPDNFSVYANPDAIEQLMVNLIVNAIKYTPWEGKIVIGSQPSKAGSYVQVFVEDTGIGIPEEDIPHIFEDFYRARNAEQMEKDGTGLGLSIVEQIIKTHGGEIWVESQIGKGSKFIFTLPRRNYLG